MEQGRVRAVELAEKFGVSRPTVTQTVHRLVADGLVNQDRSSGISLTPRGQQETEALLRRHRLAERLLFDLLGMDFVTAHEQAHALEHWISSEVEERISALLGQPETCPHGNPIPGNAPAGIDYLRARHAFRLSDAPPGARVTVVAISEVVEDESALLGSLLDKGIAPGRSLTVREEQRSDGVSYSRDDDEHFVDEKLAEKIWVASIDSAVGPVTAQ